MSFSAVQEMSSSSSLSSGALSSGASSQGDSASSVSSFSRPFVAPTVVVPTVVNQRGEEKSDSKEEKQELSEAEIQELSEAEIQEQAGELYVKIFRNPKRASLINECLQTLLPELTAIVAGYDGEGLIPLPHNQAWAIVQSAQARCRDYDHVVEALLKKNYGNTTYAALCELKSASDPNQPMEIFRNLPTLLGQYSQEQINNGADLQGAKFLWADLREARLYGAHLEGADLRGADLRGVELRWAHLEGAILEGAQLEGADLRGAQLEGADLRGADLRGVDFQRAYLRGADLRWVDLRGVDFQRADLRGADLRGADLRWADLRGAQLEGADLRGADLRWADLRWADLRGAHLEGADLRGADLRWADLRGAHLEGADLLGADLRGADLRGADLRGVDLRGTDLRGADLEGADLRGTDLRGADLQGAKVGKVEQATLTRTIFEGEGKEEYIPYCTGNPSTTFLELLQHIYVDSWWVTWGNYRNKIREFSTSHASSSDKSNNRVNLLMENLMRELFAVIQTTNNSLSFCEWSQSDPALYSICAFCLDYRIPPIKSLSGSQSSPVSLEKLWKEAQLVISSTKKSPGSLLALSSSAVSTISQPSASSRSSSSSSSFSSSASFGLLTTSVSAMASSTTTAQFSSTPSISSNASQSAENFNRFCDVLKATGCYSTSYSVERAARALVDNDRKAESCRQQTQQSQQLQQTKTSAPRPT